ncbi:MAG: hypothetical protein MJZ06_00780 [Bacteroidaceae bacterium]|nr:hypothetical protein [Bacteroidaceae bacterium]
MLTFLLKCLALFLKKLPFHLKDFNHFGNKSEPIQHNLHGIVTKTLCSVTIDFLKWFTERVARGRTFKRTTKNPLRSLLAGVRRCEPFSMCCALLLAPKQS